jgi:two-component system, NarL family, sensor kinase
MELKQCTLLFFLLLTNSSFAQDKKVIDSLYRAFHAEKDAEKKIDLLYELGNENGLAGKPEDDFRFADSVEMLSKAVRYQKGLARAYDLRGYGYRHKGQYGEALPWFRQQLEIFEKIKDLEGQGRALNNIGGTWQDMQVPDSAIVYLLRSVDLKEKLGNMGDVAAGLSNIANNYSDLKAYDKAIELLQRVLSIRRKLGEEKRSMFALNNLSVAYGRKGDLEKAIAYADTGIVIALKYNNKMVAGVICGGMGHLLNDQKKYEESIQWCERSMAYLTEVKREANTVFPLCNMAAAYIGQGQFAKGLEINKRGWEIMQRLNLQEPIDPYHENFANAYAGLKDFENAYKWHKIYFARIDTITKNDNISKIATIEAKYNLANKEKVISEQRAENFRKSVALYALLAALLAAIVFGYLFYNRFRLRKKAELDAAIIREQKLGLNAVIEAQEAERRRIAKDLHDGIAQELVGLKLGFDALGRRVGKIAPGEKDNLAELNAQLDASCSEVRNIAHVMSPPVLEQHGLAPSLELLLQHTMAHAGLQAKLNAHDLPPRLDQKVEVGLYRITQELLNNIIKHAKAAQVIIELYTSGSEVMLRVEDDGVGYNFEEAREKGSMGILNILSRASALGGNFETKSKAPHGTMALVRVPI